MTKIVASRRNVLRSGAGVLAGTALGAPMVHAQGTGGRIAVGLWDHWVPAGNDKLKELSAEFSQKHRVEVQVDLITSVGNKNLLTIAAEAQARSGHDMLAFPTWEVHANARLLEPMDDVVGRLVAKNGPLNQVAEYLAKINGKWMAMPAISGTQNKPCLTNYDLLQKHAGIDIRAMWPANGNATPAQDNWTWDAFLAAAEACHKAGVPFGLPAGTFSDATDWIGALFAGYGAHLVDARGNITIRNNDKLKQALEYCRKLFQFVPRDVFSWDDASNNRAIISGNSALIFNPPSPYAVAKRDAPQVAEKMWQAPPPRGPEGRKLPYLPFFWGVWSFSRNKTAAKAYVEFLSEREQAEKQVAATNGYDIPPFASMTNFKTWETEAPPVGVVFNYPNKPHHKSVESIAYAPAPPEIAVQMYNQGIQAKMIARMVQNNEPMDRTLAWAEREIEGFKRG